MNAPTVTQPTCAVPTGTIVVNATGSGTLEYSVNNGTNWQASNSFTGLTPGNYTVLVRLQASPTCVTAYASNPVVIDAVPIAPTVNAPTVTQPTCAAPSGTIVVNATGAGALEYSIDNGGSWQASNTFTGLTPGNYNIRVRLQSSTTCFTNYAGNPVVINPSPLPTVTNPGNQVVCHNSSTAAVTLTGSAVPATTYNWANDNTSIGLVANGTNTIPSFTATNTGIAPVTATITVTPTAGACTGMPITFTITVNPIPTVNAISNQTLCPAQSTTAITFSGSVAGTVYSWTNDNASIGLAANGTGDIAAFPAVNSGTTQQVATITVTPGYTNAGQTCTGTPITFTITVDPRPTVNVAPDAVCSPVLLTATGADTYTWSPATGLSATTGASVTATTPVTTVYTVTGTSTATGCTNTASATVLGTPSPIVVSPANPTVCAGSFLQLSVPLTSAVPTVQWSPVTGLFLDATGTIPYTAGTFANTVYASPAGTTTYNLTSTLGTCSAAPITVTVTVNPVPTIAVSPTGQCGPVTLTATGNSNTYSWSPSAGLNTTTGATVVANPTVNTTYTVTGTITATGCTKTATAVVNATPPAPVVTPSGPTICLGGITALTATNAYWSPATGLYTDAAATVPYVAGTSVTTVYAKPTMTTTYAVTVATPTCISPPTNVTVTVVQPAAITTQPTAQTVCAGATANFSVAATGSAITYQWQVNTGSGFNNIPGANNASLAVTNTTTAMSGYQYRVVLQNGCFAVTSNTVTLTVNAAPVVTATPLTNRICLSDTLVALSGTPAGGVWSGVGVTANTFRPVSTSVGTYTLTYTFTNASGCSSSATTTAKVESCPERMVLLTNNAVILGPNPNSGQFNIRINSTLYNSLGMNVINVQGQLLYQQQWSGLQYNRVIPIDLKHLPGGVYMVKFYYDDGVRTAEKTFKVIIAR